MIHEGLSAAYPQPKLEGSNPKLVLVSTQPSLLPGTVTIIGYEIENIEGEMKAGSDVQDLKFFKPEDRPRIPFRAHREILNVHESGKI